MFKWIRDRQWLPDILLSVTGFLIFGGLDTVTQGLVALVPAAFFSLAVLLSRKAGWLAPCLIIFGSVAVYLSNNGVPASALLASMAVLLQAAFAKPFWSQVSGVVSNLSGYTVTFLVAFTGDYLSTAGVPTVTNQARFVIFGFGLVLVTAVNSLAWLAGRLLMTRLTHVGTDQDQAWMRLRQAQLQLDVARQNEHLNIARDVTDLLVQRVSAVVSQADGAKYIANADPESASRVIEKIGTSARAAQSELRRLFDLLHDGQDLSAAPPKIADLDRLMIDMREQGYNATLSVDGVPYAIDEGAELCIFNVVFDGLQNVRKHAPRGSTVTVDMFWTEEGLQVLIKDNGIETTRRQAAGADQLLDGYTVEEDAQTLVERIEGATLSALAQRAALYEGTIEPKRVAGVGFTLSALFPHLRKVAGAK